MFKVVAGQDGDRPLRREIAFEQRSGDRAHRRECFCVSERAPAAHGVALRKKNSLRRRFRPIGKPLGERSRIGLQRVRRAQEHGTVGFALDQHVRGTEPDRP